MLRTDVSVTPRHPRIFVSHQIPKRVQVNPCLFHDAKQCLRTKRGYLPDRPTSVRHSHALAVLLGIRGLHDPAAGRILIQRKEPRIIRGSYFCQALWYYSGHLPQTCDIPQRWRTKHAAVLAAELRRALIADLECCTRCVLFFSEHQPPRFVQAQPFLVLQRAHCRHLPEVKMETRCAHVDLSCEVIDAERLCEVPLQPVDCPRYLIALTSRRRNLTETHTLIPQQSPVNDFPL